MCFLSLSGDSYDIEFCPTMRLVDLKLRVAEVLPPKMASAVLDIVFLLKAGQICLTTCFDSICVAWVLIVVNEHEAETSYCDVCVTGFTTIIRRPLCGATRLVGNR